MAVRRKDEEYLDRDPGAFDKLIGGLEERLDKIADATIVAYRDLIPSYSAASTEVLAETRDNTIKNITACIAILRGEMDLADLAERHADFARIRARQGFPLHEVLLSYQLGAQVVWEELSEIIPSDPQLWMEIAPAVTRLTLELLRHATTVVAKAYLEVEVARVADEEHDLQVLVETLAGIRPKDPMTNELAARRKLDLASLRWCAVTQVDAAAMGAQVQSLRAGMTNAVVGRIGGNVVVFTPGDKEPDFSLDSPVGTASHDDTTIAFGHAQTALQVAIHLKRDRIRYEEAMPLALFLEGPPERRLQFTQSQLGPLLQDPLAKDLLSSLEAYYQSGQSIAAAARVLHVHRHTLEYRLDRIATLLKVDLRDPGRRLFLELALALRS